MTTTFDGNDDLYQTWLAGHPHGFVINTRRRISPDYLVLHRASCAFISRYTATARPRWKNFAAGQPNTADQTARSLTRAAFATALPRE